MKYSGLIYFSCYLIIQFIITFYSQTYILTDDLYRLVIGSKMNDRQLDDYLEFIHKWKWISYLFIPLALILRICFTWICLKSGSYITETFSSTSFWNICIQGEIIFTVGTVVGLIYTAIFIDATTLEELTVNPFSLQVFASEVMPAWSSYFFNTLNIFELGYILFVAYLIKEESKKAYLPALKFVASTYLPGLALWMFLVSYLSIVFQP